MQILQSMLRLAWQLSEADKKSLKPSHIVVCDIDITKACPLLWRAGFLLSSILQQLVVFLFISFCNRPVSNLSDCNLLLNIVTTISLRPDKFFDSTGTYP